MSMAASIPEIDPRYDTDPIDLGDEETSGFYLAYPPFLLTRVYFYINKRLDISK
jgi:hypothetical protein